MMYFPDYPDDSKFQVECDNDVLGKTKALVFNTRGQMTVYLVSDVSGCVHGIFKTRDAAVKYQAQQKEVFPAERLSVMQYEVSE